MRGLFANLISTTIVLVVLSNALVPQATAGGYKCIDSVFYGYPGFYLHYAKCYQDGTTCANPAAVIHQAATILTPTDCYDQNCNIPCGYTVLKSSGPKLLDRNGLPEPVDPACDIEQGICAPEYRVRDDFIGTVHLPQGKTLSARVLLLDIMYEKQGRRHRATFGFGLEVKNLPAGERDELAGISLKSHEDVPDLYEGFLPNKIRCFVLTARR